MKRFRISSSSASRRISSIARFSESWLSMRASTTGKSRGLVT